MNPYGTALSEFIEKDEVPPLVLHNSYGEPEEMPLWYFFREYDEMPDLEKMALSVCEGNVLDIGAGTGCHAICLQQLGYSVTAIDTNQQAVDIMKNSKVKDARQIDYFEIKSDEFDTLFCLMNGIGFIGKKSRLKPFLKQADKLLKPDGQIILDSSDVKYLFENEDLPTDRYYGEVSFQYEYKGKKSEWFDWVYLDKDTLAIEADALGWYVYFLHSDENGQYLARLIRK
ncbi:bifunctional 2-polyprenyl-6-hydroxyphenol methylase/3-demethylubiquinol 3-O-methyltransferase UbiG [Roseivirga sp. E12]|uniref:class I SAM-dependent methyltransferase n=1 Tax=Roseivirga sp. E12 TaxID=2819237 RepID=UPI001ABC7680|nr:class I SAM-dependent methyltransferase [Roseivirga sp. E12]MBO3700711.1 methyltransferase domain-containing protein [Roseivirga sp. E12]